MMTLNGKKMSKSTGNNILPKDLISGNNSIFQNVFSPSVIKFYFFQAHYRSILDLTESALLSSEKGYNKLMESIELLDSLKVSGESNFNFNKWIKDCYNAMNDDFNSPILISKLFEIVKLINSVKNGTEEISKKQKDLLINHLNIFVFEILGLTKPNNIKNNSVLAENTIKILLKLRDKARINKDFETADLIRNELNDIGIELEDTKNESSFNIK
jgi:Cysteinyl-tRNA synthetase